MPVAFVWILIKKTLCLQTQVGGLIACMYIIQTSKEVKDDYNGEYKGELWNVYSHANWYNFKPMGVAEV